MKNIILVIFVLLIATAGIVFAVQNKPETDKGGLIMNKKILVAYFSWGGNTKYIAEKIHNNVGGDIFRIETAVPYPEDYNETAYGVAKKQHQEGIKPELKDNGNVKDYDIIFVGTPAWWYTMAPAVKTFLSENNFEGKTIVPFITHGGGGKYTIAQDMEKLAKGAKVLTPFVVFERGDDNTDKELEKWLQTIK